MIEAGRPRLRLTRAAELWIFPGLVAAMVIGNQGWPLGPFLMGQVISWGNALAAALVVLSRFGHRRWPYVVLASVVLTKALSLLPPLAYHGDLAFDVALGVLFCSAGAVIVSRTPGTVYRQALGIAVLSLPLMVLQISGHAPWSEALGTENIAAAGAPAPTLFVEMDDLRYRTSQARPTGITHSNNFLSLLVGFALALHFSRIRTRRLTWRDVIVCSFSILSMAKVALLLHAVIVAWKLVTGTALERGRMARVTAFSGGLLLAYWVLLPGLFVSNLGVYKLSYSFYIRANDFADLLPETSGLRFWLRQQLAGTPRADWQDAMTLSGYAQVIEGLPYAVVAALLLGPIFFEGLRRVRRRYPDLVDMTVLTLFVVLLYPTAVPMFRAQIFAFIAGFALLPVFTIWEPRKFAGLLRPPSIPGAGPAAPEAAR